jgi:hypothetical protein
MAVVSVALVGVAITPSAIPMVQGGPADTSCSRTRETMILPTMAGTTTGAVTQSVAASAIQSTRLGGMLSSSRKAPHSRATTPGNTTSEVEGAGNLCPPLPPGGRDGRAQGYYPPQLLSRTLKANKGRF